MTAKLATIFLCIFAPLIAGAVIWIIYDSIKYNSKKKVNDKKTGANRLE